jgi:endonuclease/exonuclease/phosphatase family metal-dependent hydrolase
MRLPSALLFFLFAVFSGLAAEPGAPSAKQLRVLTFNIRYANRGDGLNGWDFRRDAAAKVIDEQADIAGLQEVLPGQRADLAGRLPAFAFVGVGRDPEDKGEASCIFFRKDRFEVLGSGTFWLSDTPAEPGSNTWGAALPRVCTWARFRDLTTGNLFFHFNTHLDHQGQAARDKSIPLIWERIAARGGNEPVILTGDFNMNSENPAFAALPLVSTYKIMGIPNSGTSPGFGGETKGKAIDYIFLEKDRWTVKSCTILKATYDAADGQKRHVTDHWPVVWVIAPGALPEETPK